MYSVSSLVAADMSQPSAVYTLVLRSLLLGLGLPVFLQAQGLTARVNDTVSHGKVRDSRLSFDEAISLANGTLAVTSLSTAERARVSGTGSALETIVLDAAATPTIKQERALTPITGQGRLIRISGVVDKGAKPVLDVGSSGVGLSIRTHLIEVSGLEIRGGEVAVDGSTLAGTLEAPARLIGLDASNQTRACFHFHATNADKVAFYVADGALRNSPVGFDLDDNGSGGQLIVEGERLDFSKVTLGVDLTVNSSGDTSTCRWWRSFFREGDTFLRVRRTSTSNQRQMLDIVHGDYEGTSDVIDVEGNASAETVFHHHHARFAAPKGKNAFRVHPATGWFDLHGSEMVFEGDVSIHAGRLTRQIWSHNNVFNNCTIQVDNAGVAPDMLWNRYQGCRIDVLPTNTRAFSIYASEFYNTTLVGQSTSGSLSLVDAYMSETTTSGAVSVTSTVPAPWQGTTSVSDSLPRIGSNVVLASFLPPNMDLLWTVGLSLARPTTTTDPYRFYMDVSSLLIISSPVGSGLRLIPVTIPNDTALAGIEVYLQGASYPTGALKYAPLLYLPTGSRLTPRL